TQGCTLGWYAAPRWGAGGSVPFWGRNVQTSEAKLGQIGWQHTTGALLREALRDPPARMG
ncbi:MAG: hypothetical protein ACOYNR_16470, partial [Blastocatellia bacterium]